MDRRQQSLAEQLEKIFYNQLIYLNDRYFDAIALHETGVYLFKLCWHSGEIYGSESDTTWSSVVCGQQKEFYNPSRECVKEAKSFAKDFDLPLATVRPFIIFSPRSVLQTKPRVNQVFVTKIPQVPKLVSCVMDKKRQVFASEELETLIYDLSADDDFGVEELAKDPFNKKANPEQRFYTEFNSSDLLNYERPGPTKAQLDRIACSEYVQASKMKYTARVVVFTLVAIYMLYAFGEYRLFAVFPFLFSVVSGNHAAQCEFEDESSIRIVFGLMHLVVVGITIIPYVIGG